MNGKLHIINFIFMYMHASNSHHVLEMHFQLKCLLDMKSYIVPTQKPIFHKSKGMLLIRTGILFMLCYLFEGIDFI